MNINKRTNKRWMISLSSFSQEERKLIAEIAKSRRQSISAFIASLIDEAVKKEGYNEKFRNQTPY